MKKINREDFDRKLKAAWDDLEFILEDRPRSSAIEWALNMIALIGRGETVYIAGRVQ